MYDFNEDELQVVLDAEIGSRGLVEHHIRSFNEFITYGIQSIMEENFVIEQTIQNKRIDSKEDRSIEKIHFNVVIKNVQLYNPVISSYRTGKTSGIMTPNAARLTNKSYISPLHVDAIITATAYHKNNKQEVRTAEVKNYRIAGVPTMVRSKLCNTYNKSRAALRSLEEDPNDPGGYFIIKGIEWVIDIMENLVINQLKVYRNLGHQNELARSEIISKAGDGFENSFQLIIRILTNDHITISITQRRFKNVQFPFYILFRLLGVSNDRDIVRNIIYDENSPNAKSILTILENAFRTEVTTGAGVISFKALRKEHNVQKILQYINKHIPPISGPYANKNAQVAIDTGNENAIKYLNNNFMQNTIDRMFLPHIGQTPADRGKKIKYLGYIINQTILCYLGIIESSDRDSYKFKRIHTAGMLYAKVFKTQYNFIIVNKLKRTFAKAFKNTSFSNVNLENTFRSAIKGTRLERNLIQAITTGDKTLVTTNNTKITNRLSSQQLHRKNQLNILSTLRQINTPNTSSSKQGTRSSEMRRVHPTYAGFVCVIQSAPTGDKVGIHKQMALSCSITSAGSSGLLKELIIKEPKLINITNLLPEDIHGKTKVFVNGDWLGCVEDGYNFSEKCREMRRADPPKIDPLSSIYYNPIKNEINLWVDVGRLLRPLLLVHNVKGKRKVLVTKQMLIDLRDRKISIHDLRKQNVIEYISPEEQLNCLIAENINVLQKNETNPNLHYTHCEIPQAILGLPALTSPFANRNQITRDTYQTSQVKQTCGWYAFNFPFRIDKGSFIQYHNEIPLVSTIANRYIPPNGSNIVVAITCFGGYNQEDSLILNATSAARGLFTGSSYNFESAELEQGEEFRTPDIKVTSDIKAHASYAKLENGFVRRGTILEKDDVVIGKVQKYSKTTQKNGIDYTHTDRSVVYKSKDPCIVETVIKASNEDGKPFAKVKTRIPLRANIGDKFSSRAGQKGVLGHAYAEEDLPTTASGIRPDIIMSPMSIPSRMTIAQLLEGVLAKLCACRGSTADGTCFTSIDIETTAQQLADEGFDGYGREKLINGKTGEYMDALIFFVPTYYQRLQKFVKNAVYAVRTGPTCAITGQPLSGKSISGGLKIGEMEKDVLVAHGASYTLSEKFFTDSDHFTTYICRNCGEQAVVNIRDNLYNCSICGDMADIAKVHSSWSSNLFVHEMNSVNVGTRRKLIPYRFTKHQ